MNARALNARLRLALASAQRGRRELRERVAELEAAKRPAILDLPPDRRTRRLVSELRAAAVEAGEQS